MEYWILVIVERGSIYAQRSKISMFNQQREYDKHRDSESESL